MPQRIHVIYVFFFFNDTATTEIYTLSLHDALPIYLGAKRIGQRFDGNRHGGLIGDDGGRWWQEERHHRGRQSTPLNSSHQIITYDVFCLKKNKERSH